MLLIRPAGLRDLGAPPRSAFSPAPLLAKAPIFAPDRDDGLSHLYFVALRVRAAG